MVIQTGKVGTLDGMSYFMPTAPLGRFLIAWFMINVLRRAK